MLGSAMPREASWSRSNSSWGTFRCKRPNATLAANSGFDQPSMIALASSRILELSWVLSGGRVADKRLVTRRPILAPEPKETTAFLPGLPVDFRFRSMRHYRRKAVL